LSRVRFPPSLSSADPCLSLSLRILLVDEFGDGWDGLWLYINHTGYESAEYRPTGPAAKHPPKVGDEGVYFSSSTHSPSLNANPLLFTVCGSLHADRFRDRGHYTLEIKHDSSARNNWEVLWQVSTLTNDYNDWVFGDHKTKVEFEFGDDGLFHLEKVDRPLADPSACSRCDHPPPPNKDHTAPPPQNHTLDDDAPHPTLYPISFELGDSEGDGWFPNWLGTKYSISDKSKTKLLDSGTICGLLEVEPCQTQLPDGDYYFRVGGASDENRDDVSWKFCGVEGKAMEELSFAVLHGKCVPGHLSTAEEQVGAKEQTTLTLKGELLLENVFTSDLSTAEARIFESVIAQELGVEADEVMIISVCETRPGVYCSDDDDNANNDQRKSAPKPKAPGHRALSATYVLDVVFLVTMVAEKYNLIGSQLHAMKDLVTNKEDLFDSSLKSGQLQSTLRSSEQDSLAFVRLKHFVPLKHTDLSYRFVSLTNAPTPAPRSDHLNVEHVVLDESFEQATLLATPFLLAGLALLAIAGVALRERWSRQRDAHLVAETESILPTKNPPSSLPCSSSELLQEKGDTPEEDLSFELRSDLSIIPSAHSSSRSRYRPKEGGSLSQDDRIPMLNIRATTSNSLMVSTSHLLCSSLTSLQSSAGERELGPLESESVPPVRRVGEREPSSPV
jgi:hypothetical protein